MSIDALGPTRQSHKVLALDSIPIQTQHVLPPTSHRSFDCLCERPKRLRVLVHCHRARVIVVLEETTVDAECTLQRFFAFGPAQGVDGGKERADAGV